DYEHYAIGDAALYHPVPAIGMDVAHAFRSKGLRRVLQTARNQLRGLDRVVLDIDDSQAEPDAWIEITKCFELIVAAARKLEDQMMDLEAIEKRHQIFPEPFLHRLAAIIAEADMHGALAANASEHVIDGRKRPFTVFRVTANI